jgi:hypothetical protein
MAQTTIVNGHSASGSPPRLHYPKSLSFKELLAPEPFEQLDEDSHITTQDESKAFNFMDPDLPDELRLHILSFCSPHTLFLASKTSKYMRYFAMEVLFTQRHLWFLYIPRTFRRSFPLVNEGDFSDLQCLNLEDVGAAQLVSQVQIGSAAVDSEDPKSWSWLADESLWKGLFDKFESARRVMIRVKPPTSSVSAKHEDALLQDPYGPEKYPLNKDFWTALQPYAQQAALWMEMGLPGQQRYYRLSQREPVAIRGNTPSAARAHPELSNSVVVQDYVSLPRIPGSLGTFIRWRCRLTADHRSYPEDPLPNSRSWDGQLRKLVMWYKHSNSSARYSKELAGPTGDAGLQDDCPESPSTVEPWNRDFEGEELKRFLEQWGFGEDQSLESDSTEMLAKKRQQRRLCLAIFENEMIDQGFLPPLNPHSDTSPNEEAHVHGHVNNASPSTSSHPLVKLLISSIHALDDLMPEVRAAAVFHPYKDRVEFSAAILKLHKARDGFRTKHLHNSGDFSGCEVYHCPSGCAKVVDGPLTRVEKLIPARLDSHWVS